jgi:hypothetical protein
MVSNHASIHSISSSHMAMPVVTSKVVPEFSDIPGSIHPISGLSQIHHYQKTNIGSIKPLNLYFGV